MTDDPQIRTMRTTSVSTGGHCRGAGFLRRDTSQGRSTQDVDCPAVTRIDQRKLQKSKHKTHRAGHTTNTERSRLEPSPKP